MFPSRSGNDLTGDIHRCTQSSDRWMVLLHGMESTRGGTKQTAMVERFVPLGINVLRFDFSYVGDSVGVFEDMTVSGEVADALGALDFLQGFGPSDITLVGSSMGGLVSLLTVAQAPPGVRRLATIAAVADTQLFLENLSEEEIAHWRRTGRHDWHENFLKVDFLEDVLAIDAPAAISRIDVPLLVMHGDQDPVVPLAHAAQIEQGTRGDVVLEIFGGVGHRFEEPDALEGLLMKMETWLRRERVIAE